MWNLKVFTSSKVKQKKIQTLSLTEQQAARQCNYCDITIKKISFIFWEKEIQDIGSILLTL